MDIHERLIVFFRRLEAAQPVANAEEALQLIGRLIEEVEDEFCPLPRRQPPPKDFTGRMYAPQNDNIRHLENGGKRAKARHHLIFCGADGRITIVFAPTGVTVFTKNGKAT